MKTLKRHSRSEWRFRREDYFEKPYFLMPSLRKTPSFGLPHLPGFGLQCSIKDAY